MNTTWYVNLREEGEEGEKVSGSHRVTDYLWLAVVWCLMSRWIRASNKYSPSTVIVLVQYILRPCTMYTSINEAS